LISGGGVNLYFYVWELPIMSLAWKILKTFVVKPLIGKVHHSNEIISILSNEVRHISKSMLPSVKGLSIYFSC
jgi:hypothetical protein